MKPYKFEPYLKTTIWGGYQIAPFKGIYTAQPNIGESWEISGVAGHESVAINRGLVDDVDEGAVGGGASVRAKGDDLHLRVQVGDKSGLRRDGPYRPLRYDRLYL